ncbi:MAG: serine/threonine-protein kinase [Myxococcota bacterium]
MADECPDENVLTAMLEGCLARDRLAALHEHVDRCAGCTAVLVELAHVAGPGREAPIEDQPPRLGRYEVLGILGKGGMGTVYLAFDSDLDRRVALKALHIGSEGAQARLLREARAMARLSHPNVVQVHEVATFDGGWFVAMELVEGGTLLPWSRGRPWRVQLRACLEAGRGLAAAHASGLVHRDFKPSNVLCDLAGHARVTDFGLAAVGQATIDGDGDEPPSVADDSDGTDDVHTRTGAVLGTPAYMSPEQARGEPVDERSDQYSFCVTVWHILSGQHPFEGRPRGATPPLWPSDGPRVRRGVREALRRGMGRRAGERWPSMRELLTALERSSRPPRWPWVLLPLLALGAWGVVEQYERHQLAQLEEQCSRRGQEIEALWDAAAQQSIEDGARVAGIADAETVVGNVSTWLDGRATRWRTQATNACRHAKVLDDWDASEYRRARWCLDEQQLELELLLADLASDDGRAFAGALLAAAAPPRLATCDDATLIASMPEIPADDRRQRLEEVNRSLVRARLLTTQGRFDVALETARQARLAAESAELPEIALAAKALQAKLLYLASDFPGATRLARATYLEAMRQEDWDIAAESAGTMTMLAGVVRRRIEEADLWADLAEVAIVRAGDPLGLREARRLRILAGTRRVAGQYEAAQRYATKSLHAVEAALGAKHPWTADGLVELGSIALEAGNWDEGRTLLERGLQIQTETLGDHHAVTGTTLAALGNAMAMRGEVVEARVLLERARGILKSAGTPRVSGLTSAISGLATIAMWSGETEKAGRLYREVLDIDREVLGPSHPQLAGDLVNLGVLHLAGMEYPEARRFFEQALQIARLDPETRAADIVRCLINLALTYQAEEAFAEAATRFAEALAAAEAHLGPNHPHVAYALTGLGMSLARSGDERQGIEHIERAIRLRKAEPGPLDHLAFTQFALAQVLWSASPDEGQDRVRAVELARTAADGYARAEADSSAELDEVRAWLADVPASGED